MRAHLLCVVVVAQPQGVHHVSERLKVGAAEVRQQRAPLVEHGLQAPARRRAGGEGRVWVGSLPVWGVAGAEAGNERKGCGAMC